jgi:hypothetical protein
MNSLDMSVSSDTSGLDLPQLSADGQAGAVQHGQGFNVPLHGVPNPQPAISSGPAQMIGSDHSPHVTQTDQTDELDKEWINKAKLIVEQTKHDPFTQSREIGRVKADYLKIRFNKHIKLGPDQTL